MKRLVTGRTRMWPRFSLQSRWAIRWRFFPERGRGGEWRPPKVFRSPASLWASVMSRGNGGSLSCPKRETSHLCLEGRYKVAPCVAGLSLQRDDEEGLPFRGRDGRGLCVEDGAFLHASRRVASQKGRRVQGRVPSPRRRRAQGALRSSLQDASKIGGFRQVSEALCDDVLAGGPPSSHGALLEAGEAEAAGQAVGRQGGGLSLHLEAGLCEPSLLLPEASQSVPRDGGRDSFGRRGKEGVLFPHLPRPDLLQSQADKGLRRRRFVPLHVSGYASNFPSPEGD